MWLYEHDKQNENDFSLYINPEDDMMIHWTYQDIMDIAVANYGRPMTKEKLRKTLKEQIDMAVEDMMESYDLCEEAMIRETNKDFESEE